MALAKYPDLDPEIQKGLIKSAGGEVISELAGNPGLTEEAMHMICEMGDGSFLVGLVSRSSLPASIQRRLAKSNFHEVVGYLAENSSLIEELYEFMANHDDQESIVAMFAENKKLPEKYWDRFLKHDSLYVRGGLASNESLRVSYQSILAKDPVDDVRAQLAMNSSLDPDLQILLASDESIEVAHHLAINQNICQKAQEILVQHFDKGVRQALANNSALAPSLLKKLESRPKSTRTKRITEREMDAFLNNPNSEFAGTSLYENHIPKEKQIAILEKGEREEIWGLASEPYLIDEVQLWLARTGDEGLFVQLVHNNRNLIPQVQRIIYDMTTRPEIQTLLLWESNLPEDLQLKALSSKDFGFLSALARNKHLTPAVQKELANHEDTHVVATLAAECGNLSERLQGDLSEHSDIGVLCGLAWRKGLYPSVQLKLAKHPDPEVRAALAENSSLILEAQVILAEDQDESVCLALIMNERATDEAKEILSESPHEEVQMLMARFPKLQPSPLGSQVMPLKKAST